MWKILIESGFAAFVFGFVTSVSGIIITNQYNKQRARQEKKYILIKEIYPKLLSLHAKLTQKNIQTKEEENVSDIFTEALIIMYQDAERKLDELESFYFEIRYILSENDAKELALNFEEIREIEKLLKFTSINEQLKEKSGYENIVIDEKVRMIEKDKIPEYTRKYIDCTQELEKFFLEIVEKELRNLLK